MGMWQGLYLGMQNVRERRDRQLDREEARRSREEDMAFRREQFERGILEQRRNALLPILLERRERDEAVQQSLNSAVALGFQRPAAEALYRSGQLGFIVSSVEANNYAPERISAVNEEVMRQLGDRASEDTIAAALLGVVESGVDLDNPAQTELAIIESVLNASDIGELESLYSEISRVGASRPRMDRFDISLSTGEVDLPEVTRVRNEVIRRLQPIFGPNTFEVSASGDYTFTANAPADTVRMVNQLTDQVVESATRAGEGQMTTTTAIQTFTNPILDLTQQGPVDVSMINANLPVLFTQGQDAFFGAFSAPRVDVPVPAPVPVVSEPAAAITAMTERPLSTEPTSGFGFNVDEELNR
jgi:hypothetical protein